jgi:hypothetical protein
LALGEGSRLLIAVFLLDREDPFGVGDEVVLELPKASRTIPVSWRSTSEARRTIWSRAYGRGLPSSP